MKITQIDVHLLQKELNSTMQISRGGFRVRNHVIVKVHTDDGLTGLGKGLVTRILSTRLLGGNWQIWQLVWIPSILNQ